jgi:hypothetical protein
MNILAWVTVAIGVLTGGMIMTFGFRNGHTKPLFSRLNGSLRQDWAPTGNIDFRASTVENCFPQPLRLWVEDQRITESAVGQRLVELRWRLATIEEGKALVICWNAQQSLPAALLSKPSTVEN